MVGNMNNFKNITDIQIESTFDEIKNILFVYNEPIELTVKINNVCYKFFLKLKKTNYLLALNSNELAIHLEKTLKHPINNLWNWNFNDSVIYYVDPTENETDDIKRGYCLGTQETWYLEDISQIILEISKNLEIENENIIFYGSNVRANNSIMLSTMIEKSISIAERPILFLEKDNKCASISTSTIKWLSFDEILKNYSHRLNVLEFFKLKKYIPISFMIFDYSKDNEVDNHYFPFIQQLKDLKTDNFNEDNVRITLENRSKRFGYMNINELVNFIEKIKLLNDSDVRLNNRILEDFDTNITDSLMNYLSARIDIKNEKDADNSIELIEISDSEAEIHYPNFLKTDKGSGLFIVSNKCYIDFKIRCVKDGLLKIELKAPDVKDRNNRRFPVYVDYVLMKIDDEVIINENSLAWHNKPIKLQQIVEDEQILKIRLKWQSFSNESIYR